jgi:hypothetical protein
MAILSAASAADSRHGKKTTVSLWIRIFGSDIATLSTIIITTSLSSSSLVTDDD